MARKPNGRRSPKSGRQGWESVPSVAAAIAAQSTPGVSAPRLPLTLPPSERSSTARSAGKTVYPPSTSRLSIEPSETEIHIALAQHLTQRGRRDMVFWHTPNEGARTISEASRLKAMGVKAGIPDLVLVFGGRMYAIEIKTRTGKLSADQEAMIAALTASGAIVAVAYGLDQALSILDRWGAFQPPTMRMPPHAHRH